jgi:hypothetical protein
MLLTDAKVDLHKEEGGVVWTRNPTIVSLNYLSSNA